MEYECAYEDAEPSVDDPDQGWGDYLHDDWDDDDMKNNETDEDEE